MLFVERRPWDSNPQVFRPAVFKTASSPIRVTSESNWSKHRGQESNLRPSHFRARRNYQQLLPRINETPRQRIER